MRWVFFRDVMFLRPLAKLVAYLFVILFQPQDPIASSRSKDNYIPHPNASLPFSVGFRANFQPSTPARKSFLYPARL